MYTVLAFLNSINTWRTIECLTPMWFSCAYSTKSTSYVNWPPQLQFYCGTLCTDSNQGRNISKGCTSGIISGLNHYGTAAPLVSNDLNQICPVADKGRNIHVGWQNVNVAQKEFGGTKVVHVSAQAVHTEDREINHWDIMLETIKYQELGRLEVHISNMDIKEHWEYSLCLKL